MKRFCIIKRTAISERTSAVSESADSRSESHRLLLELDLGGQAPGTTWTNSPVLLFSTYLVTYSYTSVATIITTEVRVYITNTSVNFFAFLGMGRGAWQAVNMLHKKGGHLIYMYTTVVVLYDIISILYVHMYNEIYYVC
jgi:hypothetical protein